MSWYDDEEERSIEVLQGETLVSVDVDYDNDVIVFTTDTGKVYKMYHIQDCCERVYIEDIIGDVDDLIGVPILMAEEVSERSGSEEDWYSGTWTFYKLATNKGYVTLRWLGESSGYYSESVNFREVNN